MPSKRRATSPVRPSPSKRIRGADANSFNHSRFAENVGIVQRDYYPSEISNERCEMYNNGDVPRPIETLLRTVADTKQARADIEVGECVVFWFKRDLRLFDNKGLQMASDKAKTNGVPLVCMFIVSPHDYQAHLTAPARVDFELRTLEVMQKDLSDLDIPLYMATVEERKDVTGHILQKCEDWGAKHVFCNVEYEVDELRRETRLIKQGLEQGIAFAAIHDDVLVTPGELNSGQGKQYSVYTPWYRAWVKHIHDHPHLLKAAEMPDRNPDTARIKFIDLFNMLIPSTPANKTLTSKDRERLAHLWPAGEHEARSRLERFLGEKIGHYRDTRNFPAENSTAMLSVHFATGTLAARTAVRSARDVNSTKKLDGGNTGISGWISEIAWRDFYKHVLCNWPYVCMNKPFKYEYSDIAWHHDEEKFTAWCEGRTGYPLVDAAMRQLQSMAYVHNRCRMVVACFLAKDLLIDWRRGEKFFMEHLIDGDFASNNGGWGFAASTGVDPQPYFRIFNPILQSEKFDKQGEYIRKWVPELARIDGMAIHDPYGRGKAKEAEKAGYPKPIVVHSEAREKALAMYKGGLGRATANIGGGVHN